MVAALASATDLGRPGSAYGGHAFFAATAGGLMVWHRSVARRALCFVALLLAVGGMWSEKTARDGWNNFKYRRMMEQMQRDRQQLSGSMAQPTPLPPPFAP